MDQFFAGSVVWASARGDIFWPGQVIESEDAAPIPAKKHVTINFLIEDSYENIKSPSRIFLWNCEKQNKFIEKGRALKNEERRVQFNKAVAEADNLQGAEKGVMSLCKDEATTNASDKTRKGSNKKNKRSEILEVQCTVQRNSNCGRKLDIAKTNKDAEVLERSCATQRLQTKRSLKSNYGKRRKSLQEHSNNPTPKEGETNDHAQVCSAHHKLLSTKTKRKLLENGSCRKSTPTKKAKPCDQVVPGNDEEQTQKNENNEELLSMRASTSSEDNVVEQGVGTTSNGSVTSDGSSDDELLSEAFSPSQEANQFSVGDIVWAKYSREPYWPAVIKKVTGKRKRDQKFAVKFLGWNDGLFRIQPKKLEHFACESSMRAEFMDIKYTLDDKEMEKKFDEAVAQAEDLLIRKGLGKSLDDELDAELGGDVKMFEETEEGDSEELVRDVQMENKDSLQTPERYERRKSDRTKRQVSKYRDIVSYIRQSKPILKQILDGRRRSKRHTIFTSGRVSEKNQLKHRAGFGPVGDEKLQEDIMGMLVEFYKEIKGSLDFSYVADVWLPEAITWSIQEIDHVDRTRAEKMFLEGSDSAVTNAEVRELETQLKQRRKLSNEEATERIKKAKRAMAR